MGKRIGGKKRCKGHSRAEERKSGLKRELERKRIKARHRRGGQRNRIKMGRQRKESAKEKRTRKGERLSASAFDGSLSCLKVRGERVSGKRVSGLALKHEFWLDLKMTKPSGGYYSAITWRLDEETQMG